MNLYYKLMKIRCIQMALKSPPMYEIRSDRSHKLTKVYIFSFATQIFRGGSLDRFARFDKSCQNELLQVVPARTVKWPENREK